jgi:hypothetical protein
LRLRIAYNVNDFYSIYDDSGDIAISEPRIFTAFSLVLRKAFGFLPLFWGEAFYRTCPTLTAASSALPRTCPTLTVASSAFYRTCPTLTQALRLFPHLPYSYRSLFGFLPHLPYSYAASSAFPALILLLRKLSESFPLFWGCCLFLSFVSFVYCESFFVMICFVFKRRDGKRE